MNNKILNNILIIAAVVCGAFALFVSFQLISNNITANRADPLDVELLDDLRSDLQKQPDSEQLKEQIRELDLLLRKAYFSSITFQKNGIILLLASLLLTAITLKTLSALNKTLPDPGKYSVKDDSLETAQLSRNALIASLVVIVVSAVIISSNTEDQGPRTVNSGAKKKEQVDIHTVETAWPCLRGPKGLGISAAMNVPTEWDGKTGKGVIWKTPLSRLGYSSPIVVDSKVYLTCADKEAREVICFDADSGSILWQKAVGVVPGAPAEIPEITDEVSYAASTMATDGIHVFAIFGTGNVICFDLDGERKWAKNVGPFVNDFGHGSSLITWKDLLILQLDDQKRSRLLALKTESGKIAWETPRDVIVCWSTPAIVDTETGEQLAVNGNPKIKGYDPETGKELWSHECMDGEVAPSPAFGNGLIFFTTEWQKLFAIRPAADSFETAWAGDGDLPDVASPLATDRHVFLATHTAIISCFDITSGEQLWAEDTDEGFYSSPVLVGDKVYLTDKNGVTFIFEDAPEYKLITQSELGEHVSCTPAFVGDRIYIRGEKNLYCIGMKDEG